MPPPPPPSQGQAHQQARKEPTGVLAEYPIPVHPSAANNPKLRVDLFNARRVLVAVQREATGEKPPRRTTGADAGGDAVPETETEKAVRERAEVSRALASSFSYGPQHVPGAAVMNKVTGLTYVTTNGMKTLTRTNVEATLGEANRQYITDLLEGSSVDPSVKATHASSSSGSDEEDDATASATGKPTTGRKLKYMRVDAQDVLRGYGYQELDEMRFALVAVAELIKKANIFDADGRLSGLAKRDLKRHYGLQQQQKQQRAAADVSGGSASATPAAASPANGSGAVGVKPQRNLRALLMDACTAKWPYAPPEKSAVFSCETDPSRPRHKPLYRATLTLATTPPRKFTGEWMPTKRDAENAAAELAVQFLSHYKGK